MQDNIENGYETNDKSLEEKLTVVSAAEVNLKKAEEYRKDRQQRQNINRRGWKRFALLVMLAAILGIGAAAVQLGIHWFYARSGQEPDGVVTSKPIDELDENIQNNERPDIKSVVKGADVTDVSSVAENVMPAVVAINCEVEKSTVSYDFFGRGHEQKEKGISSGTGIIVGQSDREVLIVTNNHVIEDAVKVGIEFCNKETVQAEVKGTEAGNDLAVVAVKLSDLPGDTIDQIRLATLGDSDAVKMGDFVIAIGNALGYGQSVTVGYVSAKNRRITEEGVTLNLLQVDAAINHGNSGGALLDANGQVIGINSAKYSSVDVERVGYAIPISEVVPIINDLMNRERLKEEETAYLGIVGKNITSSHANSFRMPAGIYVSSITKGSPAEQAGLHLGDIITKINGRDVSTMEELTTVLRYTRGGTEATLLIKVLENGSYVERELKVVLGYRGGKK